jgi:hypothetical protein
MHRHIQPVGTNAKKKCLDRWCDPDTVSTMLQLMLTLIKHVESRDLGFQLGGEGLR